MFVPLLEKAFGVLDDIVLMGDFNVNLSKIFIKNEVNNSKTGSLKMYELFLSYGFAQIIQDFTRVDNKTQSLIDHIYVSDQNSVKTSFVLPWSLSDHFPICLIRNYNCTPLANLNSKKKVLFRKLTDESLLRINNELTKNSYSNVFGTEDVNDHSFFHF